MIDLWLGIGLGLIVAIAAYYLHCATRGGALTLGAVVASTMVLGGWAWAAIPLVYVLSFIGLRRFGRGRKEALSVAYRRERLLTWEAALSRLGWGLILVAMRRAMPDLCSYAALVGCLSTAAADLAATELGMLGAQPPRSIVNWRPVRVGTPGAISTLGLLGGVAAAWVVGLSGLVAQAVQAWQAQLSLSRAWVWLPVAALAGGMAGTLLDSLLAATAQAVYYDRENQELTEHEWDLRGRPNERVRGWAWLNGDTIDLAASLLGAAVTCVLAIWLAGSAGQW